MVFNKNHFSKQVCGTRDPLPFMANAILNFHFDCWNPSLTTIPELLFLAPEQKKQTSGSRVGQFPCFRITQQVPHLCMSWSVKLWSTWGPNRELGSDPSAPPMPVTAVAASCVLGRGLGTSGDIVQQTCLINASSVDVQGRSRYIAFRQAVQPVQMFVPFVPSF